MNPIEIGEKYEKSNLQILVVNQKSSTILRQMVFMAVLVDAFVAFP